MTLAQICQQAEHEFAGTRCGLVDQLISVAGEEGHALLIDCRNLTWEAAPIPDSAAIVVCDTGKRRGLATSAYNERRAQCEEGACLLGVSSLRDLDVGSFEARAKGLPTLLPWRCRQVVHENDRTLRAAKALWKGRLDLFGQLRNQSQASLRDTLRAADEAHASSLRLPTLNRGRISLLSPSRLGKQPACSLLAGRSQIAAFFMSSQFPGLRSVVCHAWSGVLQ